MSHGTPLPTSAARVGKKIVQHGGYLDVLQPTHSKPMYGTSASTKTPIFMGSFPIRPPNMSQTPRKIRPFDFKRLVDKLDGNNNPYNHMANL